MNIKIENLRFDHCITTRCSADIHFFASTFFRIDEKFYKKLFFDVIEKYIDNYYLWDFFFIDTRLDNTISEKPDTLMLILRCSFF